MTFKERLSKHIELQTEMSIRKFLDESKKVVDGEIFNNITNKKVTISAQQTQKAAEIVAKLNLPH
jgi:hypothetical protein